MRAKTDLSQFDNSEYHPGSLVKRVLWYLASLIFFMNHMLPFIWHKRLLLRLFGADVGLGLIIKPNVNIKYPWNLTIGDHVWIGEDVWIDNLDQVTIGNNVCVSQGAMILSGNHDYKKVTFDLNTAPIELGDGAWIGARSMVTSGVRIGEHAVLSVMSCASSDLLPYSVYQGTPAVKVRERIIEQE